MEGRCKSIIDKFETSLLLKKIHIILLLLLYLLLG